MKILAYFSLFLCLTGLSQAQNAEQIMANVRQVTALQQGQSLQGNIRHGRNRTPVSLFLEGQNIQFALDGGKERFHLRLKPEGQDLLEFRDNKWVNFPANKLIQPIANSDMTYEDLALKFLYWKNPQIVGEDTIKGEACWRIHVGNPDKNGRYREISVWVAKKHMALMRVTGYDGQRQPVKQFEITDIMKVGDVFTIKTMKVSSVQGGRVSSTTFMEFDRPRAIAPGRR